MLDQEIFPKKIYTFEEAISSAKRKNTQNINGKKVKAGINLLTGNGFSIAYFGNFGYSTLYDAIKNLKDLKRVNELFSYAGTSNFESVLRMLKDSQKVAEIYNLQNTEIVDDYKTLQNGLANAILKVHPENTGKINEKNKSSCLLFLKQFNNIYTVNYDLLLYWTVMSGDPTKDKDFGDYFGRDNNTPEEYCDFSTKKVEGIRIHYLHGALHLLESRGRVFKRVWKNESTNTIHDTLINQIKNEIENDKFPLVVAEGDSQSKLNQIKNNMYLSHVFSKLSVLGGQFFTFGFSFSTHDQHIIDEIVNNHDIRVVWVGVRNKINLEIENRTNQMIKSRSDQTNKDLKKSLEINFYNTADMDIWDIKNN